MSNPQYLLRFKGSAKNFTNQVVEKLGFAQTFAPRPFTPEWRKHFEKLSTTPHGLSGLEAIAYNMYIEPHGSVAREAMMAQWTEILGVTANRKPYELFEYTKYEDGHVAFFGSEIEFKGVENLLHEQILSRLLIEAFAQGATLLTPDWVKKVNSPSVKDKRQFLKDNQVTIKADFQQYLVAGKKLTDCGAILGQSGIVNVGGIMTYHIDGKLIVSIVVGTNTTHPLCGINIWSWLYDPKRPGMATFFNWHFGKHPFPYVFDLVNLHAAKYLMPTTWMTVPCIVAASKLGWTLEGYLAEKKLVDIANRRTFFQCADMFSGIGVFFHEHLPSSMGAEVLQVQSPDEMVKAMKEKQFRDSLYKAQLPRIFLNDQLFLPADTITGSKSSPGGDSLLNPISPDLLTELRDRVAVQAQVSKGAQDLDKVKTKLRQELSKEITNGTKQIPENVWLELLENSFVAATLSGDIGQIMTNDVVNSLLDELSNDPKFTVISSDELTLAVQDLANEAISEEILKPGSVADTWTKDYVFDHFFLNDPQHSALAILNDFVEEHKAAEKQLDQIKLEKTGLPAGNEKLKELEKKQELAEKALERSTEKVNEAKELHEKLKDPDKLRDSLKHEEKDRKEKFLEKKL